MFAVQAFPSPGIPSRGLSARWSAAFPVAFGLSALFAAGAIAQPAAPIRFATIGADITAGSGYPAKLQALLGPAFKVENQGVSGCTMLKQGDLPYWTKGRMAETWVFKPDIVTVDLGGNDAKPGNWDNHKDEFIADFQAMVDSLGKLPTKPRVFPSTPQPTFPRNGSYALGISNVVIKNEIIPKLKAWTAEQKLPLIDSYSGWENLDLTSDGVHPDPAKPGADSIAAFIYRTFKANTTRIACIGNSITDDGHSAGAYPIRFNQLLGRDYLVLNAGHSGKTLLRKGDAPYSASPWFAEVFKFQPNEITIKLGTNDSKSYNWGGHKGEYASDLRWLIDTLMTIPTKPRIFLCTPIPAWPVNGTNNYGIDGQIIKNEIIPKIKQVAAEKGLTVLDLHTPYLPYQNLTPDGVHPNAAGLDTLAHILFRAYQAAAPTVAMPDQARPARGARAASRSAVWNPANPLSTFDVDATGRKPR
jgi:acyl-CoA thioesterase I